MRVLQLLLLLVFLCAASDSAQAKRGRAPKVDYLSLAAILAQDGNYERAQNALGQVDLEDEDLDRARYHLVRGIIRLNQQLFPQAAEDFESSIAETLERQEHDDDDAGVDPIVYVYLGQAYFYSTEHEKALEAMDKAGGRADEIRSTFALRAEALWQLERHDEAWEMLRRGRESYPDYGELYRRQVFYAVDRKLFHVAVNLGTVYLASANAGYEDYLTLGNALQNSGDFEQAVRLLELAHLRNPDQPDVAVALARVYQQRGSTRTAAALMERIALRGVSEAFIEAAELYRQSGELLHAMNLNRYIVDSKTRLRQRLLILLDLRDYEALAAMSRDLRRVRLLEDENIRYALAFAFFETQEFDKAENLLTAITKPELFRKAAELRKTMAQCRESPWTC